MAQPIYLDSELQGLEREKQLAQALVQRGLKPVEGQTVSGRYVAPSWTQNLANMFDIYSGNQRLAGAEKQGQAYADALRQQTLKDIQGYGEAMKGTPEQAIYGAGEQGPTKEITTPEVASSPEKALGVLMGSKSPQSQALAQALLAEQLKTHVLPEGGTIVRGALGGGMGETVGGGIKLGQDVKDAAVQAGLDPRKADQWTQSDWAKVRTYESQAASAKRPVVTVNTGQTGFDNTLKLRKDFQSEPTYKAFQEVDSAYRQIESGLNAKSPAGDLAAATKFMKLLDPGSVVRESELSMAMNATGKLDKVSNYAKNIINGTKLTPAQREDFRAMSNDLFNAAANQYTSKQSEYGNIAKRNQLNIEDVTGKVPSLKATKEAQGQVKFLGFE
jgi:hypothetical protein